MTSPKILELEIFSSKFFYLVSNFLNYFLILLLFIILLVISFFAMISLYFHLSKNSLKRLNKKSSSLRRKKNISFDIIDHGFRLNRNTDRILNRENSTFLPSLIDDEKNAKLNDTDSENMYELPFIPESQKFQTFSTNKVKQENQMKSFNIYNMPEKNDKHLNGNIQNFNNHSSYVYDSSYNNDSEFTEDKTYFDDRYSDFYQRDEIYFKSKPRSNIFNPTLISQCLEYDSANGSLQSNSKKQFVYSD